MSGATIIGSVGGTTPGLQYYTTNLPSISIDYNNGSGMDIHMDKRIPDKDSPGMPPKIYFDLIKSKLSVIDKEILNDKLMKLASLVVNAKDLGQHALYEDLSKKILLTAKEQELSVCGISHVIPRAVVTKYQHKVKSPSVHLSSLESYSRPIPVEPSLIIKKYKDLNVFDRYEVLYLEYREKMDVGDKVVAEPSVQKSNKEKIKEKDPILFGIIDLDPSKMYYITDWIDEYCDLTLEKLVATIKADDPEYKLEKIEKPTAESIAIMVQEVKERAERLKNTKPSNYKELMKEEDASYTKKVKKAIKTVFKSKREKK